MRDLVGIQIHSENDVTKERESLGKDAREKETYRREGGEHKESCSTGVNT